ncbi:chorismate-binding protein [Polyangium aurulentum]|uniref:chorismate-binding protein n=1 Tax=Polyangium aurulentum TaxID=2567896 RepID=UPI0010ADFA8E|nr:anthranilate synthase component I family protein [Polyangium aurulentum]UQA56427.1 anthranilate synthase component I family protein [Polyangium aurulentum]
MLFGRQILIAPDPLAIADLFHAEGAPGLALLHAADRTPGPFGRFSFVACDPDRVSRRLDPLEDDAEFLPGGERGFWGGVPRWIGVVPYEARRALERPGWVRPDERAPALVQEPMWLRYPAVVAVDHGTGHVFAVGTDLARVEALASRLRGARLGAGGAGPFGFEAWDGEPPEGHLERVARAKELIMRGELYQVNLARRIAVALRRGRPLDLHRRLSAAAPSPFAACLHLGDDLAVVSTSPELLLLAEPEVLSFRGDTELDLRWPLGEGQKGGGEGGGDGEETRVDPVRFGRLFTCPIKGTRPRGKDAVEDADLVRQLDEDPKENAELTMIIDVERHDLGRVAATGSVRVLHGPGVVTHRTVHHREALLVASARPGATRADVLASMLPSGSVTGAPKVRAMEVIAALEAHRRGLYTGGFGHVAHDGGVTLAMAIRTVVLRGEEGEYFTGGGIVADSDPARELEETRWKALQLERAAGSLG